MHPFFELAFSLRPPEPSPTISEASTAEDSSDDGVLQVSEIPRWRNGEPKWRCKKCMPFNSQFASEEGLNAHILGHKIADDPFEGGEYKYGGVARRSPPQSPTYNAPQSPTYNAPQSPTYKAPRTLDTYSFGMEYMRDIGEDTARSPEVPLSVDVLDFINPDIQETQLLILAPSRDTAMRVHEAVSLLAEPHDITSYPCIGGSVIKIDMMALGEGPHVVTGTLGRVDDMISRGALRTGRISVLAVVGSEVMFQRSTYNSWFSVWNSLASGVNIMRLGPGQRAKLDGVVES